MCQELIFRAGDVFWAAVCPRWMPCFAGTPQQSLSTIITCTSAGVLPQSTLVHLSIISIPKGLIFSPEHALKADC